MAEVLWSPARTVTVLVAEVDAGEPQVAVVVRALVEGPVAAHQGVSWSDSDDDGRVVGVFATASGGVAAALVAQRVLVERVGPRVRIAVLTGEARLVVGGDRVRSRDIGAVLLRASRLCASAHGGQVLLAAATADLAAETLPDGASLVELGVLRLGDAVRQEPVFQLAHHELPVHSAVLRSCDSALNRLPTPVTSMLGRDAELTALSAELAVHRCVTLTGSGGVGKTRLAQQVAADLIGRHTGGTWWVELASSGTPQAVLAAVAEGVQLQLRPEPGPQQQLAAHVQREQPTLLVLDNCEHVIATVAELVHRLLIGCPSLTVLATSRERLDVPGERVWRVASLAAPNSDEVITLDRLDAFDAVSLFIERARQVRPNFVVNDRTAPHIAAICARLDGIPLAIELAAARTRSLPVERVSSGLDDVFGLLVGGPQLAVPRQQTLLASITWSYDLLAAADRAVLRRLSICPTWFDIDGAEAVTADDDVGQVEVLDRLTHLVDKNLVEYDDATGRFRMLETIRQFGMNRLTAAGEDRSAARRYADYWAAYTLRSGGGAGRYEPHALIVALTDIMTMLEWAMKNDAELADRVLAATAPGLFGLSRWPEIQRACDWVTADRPRTSSWAGAIAAVSMGATLMGRNDVLQLTNEALRVAEQDKNLTAALHLRVGPTYVRLADGDLSTARALAIDAISAGENYPAFAALTAMAEALAYLGQLDELGAACRDAQLTLSAGFDIDGSAAGPARAVAEHLAGDLEAAASRFPTRKPAWELMTRMWAELLTRVAIDLDDRDLAKRATALTTDDDAAGSVVHLQLAVWGHQTATGDLDAAATSARAAIDAAQTPFQRAHAESMLAATLARLERWDETWQALGQIDELLAHISEPAPRPRATCAVIRAIAALATDQLGEADRAAFQALQIARTAGLHLIHVDALESVAAVAFANGDHARAARLAAAADAERRRRNYRGRFTSPLSTQIVARLNDEQQAEWAQGAHLKLDQATALAQRGRGPRGRPAFGIDALTHTEQLVVELVSHGRTNAEIATELFISVSTVKTHLHRIFTKLGTRNRAELTSLINHAKPNH